MGKVKKKKLKSIKRTFLWYLPICAVAAYLGAYGIGFATNELQAWYEQTYSDVNYKELLHEAYGSQDNMYENGEYVYGYEIVRVVNGFTYYDVYAIGKFVSDSAWHNVIYNIISYAQLILMPAWVLLCVGLTGILFYKRELKRPIEILMAASEKISENCLDFKIEEVKPNELGQLCRSFEDMRQALYQNNQEMWRLLEERKRLNAAFSHDIRTPLAVLKGYQELLFKFTPEGKVSEEQLLEMLETMGNQIARLENYTQKMSAVQKLEDIVPELAAVNRQEFVEQCRESGKLLAGELEFELFVKESGDKAFKADTVGSTENAFVSSIYLDRELVSEVYENLLSNAARFAKSKIAVTFEFDAATENGKPMFALVVEDDGPGFPEEALHRGTDPFYSSEKDGRVHFGLGLYICKLICEKHDGTLRLDNGENGAQVTATFRSMTPDKQTG